MALENLTESEAMRRTEYVRRRKFYDEKTINAKLREEQEREGWIYVADLKSGAKMKKAKSHDEVLENRIWGTSKNRRYFSNGAKLPSNDSVSFSFRFMDVHP